MHNVFFQDTMILTKYDVHGTVQKQQVPQEPIEDITTNKKICIPVIYCLALT